MIFWVDVVFQLYTLLLFYVIKSLIETEFGQLISNPIAMFCFCLKRKILEKIHRYLFSEEVSLNMVVILFSDTLNLILVISPINGSIARSRTRQSTLKG